MRLFLILALGALPASAARQVRTPLGQVVRLGTIHASPLFQFPDAGRREAMLAASAYLDAADAGRVPWLSNARVRGLQAVHLAPALNHLSWSAPEAYDEMLRRLLDLPQLDEARAAEAFAVMRSAQEAAARLLARESSAFLDHTVRDLKTPRSRAGLEQKLGEAESVAREMRTLSLLYGAPLAALASEASARAGELRGRKAARFGDEQAAALAGLRPAAEPVAADYGQFRPSAFAESPEAVRWVGELPPREPGRLPAAARVSYYPAKDGAPARLTTQVYDLSPERPMTRAEAGEFVGYFARETANLRVAELGAPVGLSGRYGELLASMQAGLGLKRAPSRQPRALKLVLDVVRAWRGAGKTPIAVFDLDDTLFDTSRRHVDVLHAFAADPELSARFPDEAELMAQATPEDIGARYEPEQILGDLGVHGRAVFKAYREFWNREFYRPERLALDELNPGAAAYLAALKRRGAVIVYLTARWSTLRGATEDALRARGLPLPDGTKTILVMKDPEGPGEIDFKRRAMRAIRQWGSVAAFFDNHPEAVSLARRLFPDALPVFVETRRPRGTRPPAGIPRVVDFREPAGADSD